VLSLVDMKNSKPSFAKKKAKVCLREVDDPPHDGELKTDNLDYSLPLRIRPI